MIRPIRALALAALLAVLGAGAARAQEVAATDTSESSQGEPLYGYVGTAFLAAGALFVLCKSARR